MKVFLKKITGFIIPLLLLLAPPFLTLYTSGENFKSIDEAIFTKTKYLIGYAYNENNYNYLKWKSLVLLPVNNVLAIGSSRVLQFRDKMFNTSFYNAGYSISSINDFVPFLKSLPKEKYPQYIIVGIDQWMFNKKWDNLSKIVSIETWSSSFSKIPNFKVIKNIWLDLIFNKTKLIYDGNDNKEITKIGLNSYVNNSGFRNDGSFYYGSQIEKLLKNDSTASDFKYKDTFERINTGTKRFEYGESVNKDALNELDNFLNYCSCHDIYVVGFLPPFADKVNEKLKQSKYNYIDEIMPKAQEFFNKYNFELYNFSHLCDIESGDEETIDGFHGGELAYLKILIKMIESNSKLKNVSNIVKLKEDLVNAKNRYFVYEY